MFLLIQPFYHKGLSALTCNEVGKLILVMTVVWSVTTIIPFFEYGSSNFLCFVMLYTVVFYIKKFNPKIADNKKLCAEIAIGCYIIAILSIIAMDLLGRKINIANTYACYFIRGNYRVLPFIISIAVFVCSTAWKVQSKAINYIAGLTFGVYLIHMYPPVMEFLFEKLFNIKEIIDNPTLPLLSIAVVAAIYIGCSIIEAVRQLVYKFTFDKIEKYISSKKCS